MDRSELKKMLSEVLEEKAAKEAEKQKELEKKYADFDQQVIEQPQAVEKKNEAGITFTRVVKCLGLHGGDPERALYFAGGSNTNSRKGLYADDREVMAFLKALSTDPSDGGFLINEAYANDIIPLLYDKVAVLNMGARRLPLPNGNLNLPKLTGGATSYYLGESQDATVSQPTFGNVKLSSKKLITLVPISNDLLRTNSIAADRVVRDDMIQQMRLKMDYTAMYGEGTEYTPLGIKKSITTANISIATGTSTLTADVIGSLVGTLMEKNLPMTSVGFIFPSSIWSAIYALKTTTNQYIYRDEMRRGTLEGFPFRISDQITSANSTAGTTYRDIFFGDFSEMMFGDEMSFEFSMAKEGSYYDGSQLQSTFSRDETALKIVTKHDFALRHDTAFLVHNYPNA